MDTTTSTAARMRHEQLESFQQFVINLFQELETVESDELLSVPWLHKVLNTFLRCLDRFTLILSDNQPLLSKSTLTKEFTSDYLRRIVIARDVVTAILGGIDSVRKWDKQIETVGIALKEGQWYRARNALKKSDFPLLLGGDEIDKKAGSLVCSVMDESWSAYEKLKWMANGIRKPNKRKVKTTNGLANSFFTMSIVVYYVTWVLVAAIPCQGRCLKIKFEIPRKFKWGMSMVSTQRKIMDLETKAEWNEREKSNHGMLLKEIHQMVKCLNRVVTGLHSVSSSFSSYDLLIEGAKQAADELGSARDSLLKNLDDLELHLKGIFSKIESCKNEVDKMLSLRTMEDDDS